MAQRRKKRGAQAQDYGEGILQGADQKTSTALEPQEDSEENVIKEILARQVKTHKEITELGKTVPVQFITDAKAFISRSKDFRSEIEEDLEDITEQLQ